jgi:hypothetical protein
VELFGNIKGMDMEHLEVWALRDDVLQDGLGRAVNAEAHDTSERRHDSTHITVSDHATVGKIDTPEWCLACLADDLHILRTAKAQGQALEATASSKKRNEWHSSPHDQRLKRITDIGGKGLHGLFCELVAFDQFQFAEGTAPA